MDDHDRLKERDVARNGWDFGEIVTRFTEWSEHEARQTEADLPRVDGKAVGELLGSATEALSEGRRRGLAQDITRYNLSSASPEEAEHAVGEAIDNLVSTGNPEPLPTPHPSDNPLGSGLDWDSIPAVQSDEKDRPRVLTGPPVVPIRRRDGQPFSGVHVSDLPDIATVEEVSTLRQREGDQPLPEQNDSTYIQDLVIEDIQARLQVGISRYGTGLQPFNGRDSVQDAYEESLDLTMYLRQVLIEQQVMQDHLAEYVEQIEDYRNLFEDIQMILGWEEKAKHKVRAIRQEIAASPGPWTTSA